VTHRIGSHKSPVRTVTTTGTRVWLIFREIGDTDEALAILKRFNSAATMLTGTEISYGAFGVDTVIHRFGSDRILHI
jgi:hypothetical protein